MSTKVDLTGHQLTLADLFEKQHSPSLIYLAPGFFSESRARKAGDSVVRNSKLQNSRSVRHSFTRQPFPYVPYSEGLIGSQSRHKQFL